MESVRVETEVKGPGSLLTVGQVRRSNHHHQYSRHFGHRQDESKASFLEDLGKLDSEQEAEEAQSLIFRPKHRARQ